MSNKTTEKKLKERFEKKFRGGLYGKWHAREAPKSDPHQFPTLMGGSATVLTDKVWQFIESAIKEAVEAEREREAKHWHKQLQGMLEHARYLTNKIQELSQQKGNDEDR